MFNFLKIANVICFTNILSKISNYAIIPMLTYDVLFSNLEFLLLFDCTFLTAFWGSHGQLGAFIEGQNLLI